MGRLTASVALVLVLASCGGGAGGGGVSVRVESSPFRITLLEGGRTIVSQNSEARLRYQLAASGEQRFLTDVISSRGGVGWAGSQSFLSSGQ